MTTLPPADQEKLAAAVMRYFSRENEEIRLTKHEVLHFIEGTDNWIDVNRTDYNNALDPVVRTNLTEAQKTLGFCLVAMARVSLPFARKLFEVD